MHTGGLYVPKVIVPIGFDGGPVWELDPASGAAVGTMEFEVLKQKETVGLSHLDYRIWQLAYADPEASSRCVFGRYEVENLAALDTAARHDETSQPVDASTVVDTLFKWGVLAEFDPADESGIDFLKKHRLFPIGDGLGNTREDPGSFRIGREGRVLLTVVWDVYAVWTGSAYSSTLWGAVEEYYDEIEEPLFSLENMGRLVASAVPGIVANRCGFLQAQ
jgi:hypothetical protein